MKLLIEIDIIHHMYKKLILMSSLININCFKVEDSQYRLRQKYIYLYFHNIAKFQDKKGNYYYKKGTGVFDHNNVYVVFYDRNGTPINNIVTTDFVKHGYLNNIQQFQDFNGTMYYMNYYRDNMIITDENNNIVIITDKNDQPIKI